MEDGFRALVSSDWNQCLSPCGPFDPIVFHYPELAAEIGKVFRDYTGNRIRLSDALDVVAGLTGGMLSAGQMDAYLDAAFELYPAVLELAGWCRENRVALMINTTGFKGYFQRLFAKNLFPVPQALAANRVIDYRETDREPPFVFDLRETADKGIFTAKVARRLGLRPDKVVVIGDSGGDGPHFQWGAENGAELVAAFAKPSLIEFCRSRGIEIGHFIGKAPAASLAGAPAEGGDFMKLVPLLEEVLSR